MKNYFLAVIIFCFTFSVHAQPAIPVFSLTQYQKRVNQKNDTLYIVNFWATWCKPCVEELPSFEKAAQSFSKQPVKIILVSQDAKARTQQVKDFLKKNNYCSESFILSEGNPNIWINKIEKKWSGSLPATLLYKKGTKIYFHEGEYASYEELEKIIHSKL